MAATVPTRVDARSSWQAEPAGLTADEPEHGISSLLYKKAWLRERDVAPANKQALRDRRFTNRSADGSGITMTPVRNDRAHFCRTARGSLARRHPRQHHDVCSEHGDLVGPALGTRPHVSSGGFFTVRNVKLPVVVTFFPDEITQRPRPGQSARLPHDYYNSSRRAPTSRRGSKPEYFVTGMRDGFRSLRSSAPAGARAD